MRLNLAERILNQDVLSKDEALALFEDETIDTFELLNEAYIIRKHFSGKSETQYDIKCEKWNLFRRLWLLRSIGENERKQRYALVEPDKIKGCTGSDGESYWYILYCHEWTWAYK